ncbi:hypothetical protein GCM10025783_32810 [Amnibacterium soli]|uniref:ABC transporter permease n=1 Tax=Amnibacterium soli TaxID=1282736 RepID=A0ABP8ZHD1_9MICO
MTDEWAADSIRPLQQDAADDWRFVPAALRPVRARGLLAVLVIAFAAALVVVFGLPSYG